MSATKIIGVIGLGSIGMRHAKNLRDMGHHVWGADPDTKKKLELGFDYCSSKIEDLLTADAFVIASPTNTHCEILARTAGVGKPCFVEKPIGDKMAGFHPDYPNCHPVMVGYNLRWHSCVKQAKEWISWSTPGAIGDPIWANFTCAQYNDKPAYLRDGVILNWSHEIDLALYLLGPAKVASSAVRLTVDGYDDLADINLRHESGCCSSIHLDYLTKPEVRQTIIVGTTGTVILDLVSRNAWLRAVDGSILDHIEGDDSWDKNYVEEMQAFLDRIDGEETIGATGEDGLKVLEICLEVRRQAGLT